MLDVAGYINEADRDSEHIAVIKNLQDNIVEWQLPIESDLVLYGRLIKDGEIKIKPHTDQRTKSRYVFIFNRAMFICKQMKVCIRSSYKVIFLYCGQMDRSYNFSQTGKK